MESLFRFVLARPPVAQDPSNPSIRLAQQSTFQADLASAGANRNKLLVKAEEFAATPDFIGSPSSTPLSDKLSAFQAKLAAVQNHATISRTDLLDAVAQSFNQTAGELVQSTDYKQAQQSLRDSIVAMKLFSDVRARELQPIAQQLRDFELILQLTRDESFPSSASELRRYRRRSFVAPEQSDLASILSTSEREKELARQREQLERARRERAQSLLDRFISLRGAVNQLASLESRHFVTTLVTPRDAILPPNPLQPVNRLNEIANYVTKLGDLNVQQLQRAIDSEMQIDPSRVQDTLGAASATRLAQKLLNAPQTSLDGMPKFEPRPLAERSFRLRDSASSVLSESTRKVLADRQIDATDRSIHGIIDSLNEELETTREELNRLFAQPERRVVRSVGDTLVTIRSLAMPDWIENTLGPIPTPFIPPDWRIPHSRGDVSPSGIADLLIVKQQLIGYEAADIAHIENVLQGEKKLREHTRRQQTEQLTFREQEVSSSEERELESTNRFEMTRESNTTLKEDASLKAGLTVSGKYGPTVEFSASAEGALSRSKEEATKSATRFSQDVTSRSANKIAERIFERTSLLVTNEIIEKNTHKLSGTGDSHTSGIYQWVNKVYRAQIFNYGIRTLFDFMLPEPAAYIMDVLNTDHSHLVEIERPEPFLLAADQITFDNYLKLARMYQATDVSPPPEEYRFASLDFKAGPGDVFSVYTHSAQIALDDGYKAISGEVAVVSNVWRLVHAVDVVLGGYSNRFDGEGYWQIDLDGEKKSVTFGLVSCGVGALAVTVRVLCQRTEFATRKWRLETHAKLVTAFRARQAEYEDKLAVLQVQAGVAIRGRNPGINLEIMRDELKKQCISILTGQHFDMFAAVGQATDGTPQIDIREAEGEGPYVRFFEQSFEWEHMTWTTYPYFWGRKDQWRDRVGFDDPDPAFNQFLKAGYCRVTIPARPGFEGALDHFMSNGELWNGGPLPPISSPLYLAIADEIAERLERPGDELPQGEPWTVRVPTTLVKLRKDDNLPKWEQGTDGEWREVSN